MAHLVHIRHGIEIRHLTVAIIIAWFVLAVVGSLLGVFNSEPRPPIMLGLAVVVPIVAFAFCYLESVTFRQFVLSLDLRLLTLAQTWRVLGFVFLFFTTENSCLELLPFQPVGET